MPLIRLRGVAKHCVADVRAVDSLELEGPDGSFTTAQAAPAAAPRTAVAEVAW